MCGCLSGGPHWGRGLQPRHVPCLGIKQRPFGLQARAQSTELHQPGLNNTYLITLSLLKECL